MKPNEAASIFKLNDLMAQAENSAHVNPPVEADGTKSTVEARKIQGVDDRLAFYKPVQASSGKEEGIQAVASGRQQSVFGLLKLIDGASSEWSEAWARRREASETAPGLKGENRYSAGGPSLPSRFSGYEHAVPAEAESGEEERRLARRLSARFQEPVPVPRQTIMSALTPYMAATGFFVFIAGGSAVYFVADGTSSKVRTVGSAIAEPRIPADLKVIAAWSAATNAAPQPNQEQTSVGKQSIQRVSLNAGSDAAGLAPAKGWSITPVEPDAKLSSPNTPLSAQSSREQLQTWAETVEAFRQFVGARPVQQAPKAASIENERLLEKLAAWESAKKPQ